MEKRAKARIDYKKAYDMVPPSWIIDCLKMYPISSEVIKFIKNTMENCRVELTAEGKSLTEVKIQRGNLPRTCTITITIHNSDNTTQLHVRKCTGGYKLYKSQENNQPPNVHGRHQTACKK